MQEVLARLTGRSNELLSYDEVVQKLKLHTRIDRGIQNIPVKAIVGSVGRYTDFTRSFLPRKESDKERWARVKAVMDKPGGTGLPPIEVYMIGEIYFVLDGNHRVSIANQDGVETIEAHVIEVPSKISISPDMQPDEFIIKTEYAEFLEETNITSLRPNINLSVTAPGQYQKLLEHIEVHRYFMGLDFKRDITFLEAVEHWYDTVYLPFIDPIRERGLLRWFPNRTETDLYLWVSQHRAALEEELGWSIRPETAIENLAVITNPKAVDDEIEAGTWRTTKIYPRYNDSLFNDILVPVDAAPENWHALEQAILIAQQESSNLHGLHVTSPDSKTEQANTTDIQTLFQLLCKQKGLNGALAVKSGDISDQICEHALLTDLIVLNVSHPPEPGLHSLGSGLRSIIRRSARPILTVPGKVSPLSHALVAFDGSEKSKEALFIATYLAERWQTSLSVLSIQDSARVTEQTQAYARTYLELHEIQAEFFLKTGSAEVFLEVIKDMNINLMVIGSYSSRTIMQEIVIGSTVNFLLREANCPVLICR